MASGRLSYPGVTDVPRISSSPTSRSRRTGRYRVDDADLEPGHGPAQERRAGGSRSGAKVDGRRVALGLEDPAVDGVDPQARHRVGERAGDDHLGHPEGREDPARPRDRGARRPRRTTRTAARVDRLGAVEGEPQAGQVERSVRRLSARVASTQEKLGPAVAVPPKVDSHSQPAGRRGEEVLRGAEHELGSRWSSAVVEEPDQAHVVVERQPGHEDVVVEVEGRGRRRWRRGWPDRAVRAA